jgi:formylglycine-generating enzyme required for sulfatase activity
MELDEIRQRLAAVEGELKRWGLDLGESFGNLERAPSATCVQAGVVIEQMLRDLWKRLKLKGSPDRKQFEDLLTVTSKKLEEDGEPIPVAILTDIRDIQLRRNQAAHHWNVNRRVAAGILGSLADVMTWYFVVFLGKEGNAPESDSGQEAPWPPPPTPDLTNSIGMTFVRIPPGTFLMGSPDSDEWAWGNEKPQHQVTISKPFLLANHPVTQGQYRAVTGQSPSHFKGSDDLPVECVSWNDAIAFCNMLSEREGLKPYYRSDAGEPLGGDGYRLPTEAEWEYACRAGTKTRYSFGDNAARLGEYAWYRDNSDGQSHPVGQKKPNDFGLYDIHGNVWEWCLDSYKAKFYRHPQVPDPWCSSGASVRVIRGGSWSVIPRGARSAFRNGGTPDARDFNLGFRLARGQSGNR